MLGTDNLVAIEKQFQTDKDFEIKSGCCVPVYEHWKAIRTLLAEVRRLQESRAAAVVELHDLICAIDPALAPLDVSTAAKTLTRHFKGGTA